MIPFDDNHYEDDGVRIKSQAAAAPSPVIDPHVRIRATRDLRPPDSSLHSSAAAEHDEISGSTKKKKIEIVAEDGVAVLRDPKQKIAAKRPVMAKKVTAIVSTSVSANSANLMPPSSAAAGTKSTSDRPKGSTTKTTTNELITLPFTKNTVILPENERSNTSVAVSPTMRSPKTNKKQSDSYKVESTQQQSNSGRHDMAPTQAASSINLKSSQNEMRRPRSGTPVPSANVSQRGNETQSVWTAISARPPLSVHTGLESTMSMAPTMTCVDWDETKALTYNVNLASRQSPSLFCIQLRWVLLAWAFVLSFHDSVMLVSCIFQKTVFLRFTFHYVFLIAFPTGPALLYLMISQKFSGFWWKTHIAGQVFRLFLNSFLFADYYFAWQDEKDLLEGYYVSVEPPYNKTSWIRVETKENVSIVRNLNMFYAIGTATLGVSTVLSVMTFGFATSVYYYEKEAVVRKQDRWKRRLGEVLEAQGVSREAATILSTDVISTGNNCQMNIIHESDGNINIERN